MSIGVIQFNRLMKIHTLKSTFLNLLVYIAGLHCTLLDFLLAGVHSKDLNCLSFFQGHVTGHDYIHMLQNEMFVSVTDEQLARHQ